MNQLLNLLLAIDKAHTVPQMILNCEPGLGGLNQVSGHNHPTPSGREGLASLLFLLSAQKHMQCFNTLTTCAMTGTLHLVFRLNRYNKHCLDILIACTLTADTYLRQNWRDLLVFLAPTSRITTYML